LDFNGETALMKAIQLPSNYQHQTFPELLNLLRDCAGITDYNDATLLHHISQSSLSVKDWKYTRYYGQCIIDFLKQELTEGVSISEFINAQDCLGNTALHYACKQRNFKLVDLLLSLDAKTDIVNFSGKKASWFARKDFRMSKLFELAGKDDIGTSWRTTFQVNLLDDDHPSPVLSEDSEEEDDVRHVAENLMNARTISMMAREYGEYVPESKNSSCIDLFYSIRRTLAQNSFTRSACSSKNRLIR
jgi:hypothetical protein